MASMNLEQGIQAVQQQDMTQGKRLIKIAMKNDSLAPQERIQAFIWLAETDPNPQFKVEQYQQAIQLDPSNQDVMKRLTYWSQQVQQQSQQGGTPSQGMPAINPQQQQFNQQFTLSQGMPPVNPNQVNQQQNWQQSQQQQQFNQQFTPSQGMPPVNPNQVNQQQNWQQSQQQQQFNQQFTPSQGMPPVQPNQTFIPSQGRNLNQPNQQQQQQFNQQFTPSQGMPPVNPNQASGGIYGEAQAIQLQDVQRTVGIMSGATILGTGFFVTRDGLIATTRHIISGNRDINIQLLDGRHITGQVVRGFPEYDLALVKVNVQVAHLLGVSQSPLIRDDMPIVAVTHAGDGIRSAKRRSVNEIEQHWFPTLINHLKDAGGNPVFDANNMLVGMLTHNASRSNGYMYGLHIHKVYECIDQYLHEKAQLARQKTIYCSACGITSRAPSFGGYFCEHCGNTHVYALNIERVPQENLSALYGEDRQQPCPNCTSQVGFYDRACMRCGHQL